MGYPLSGIYALGPLFNRIGRRQSPRHRMPVHHGLQGAENDETALLRHLEMDFTMSSVISLDQVPPSPEAGAQKTIIDAGKDVASSFSDENKPAAKEPRQSATPEVTQVSGQRYTRAFLTMQVSLKSNTAFQIVMYNFRRFNDAMANATFVLQNIATQEEVSAFFKLVDDIFEQREKEIKQAYDGARAILAAKGLDGMRANYSTDHVLEVPYHTPRSLRFLRLVQDLDQFIGVIDTCWLSGFVTDDEHKQILAHWEKMLRDLSTTLFRKQQQITNDARRREGEAVANAEVEVVAESAEDIGTQSQGGPAGETEAAPPEAN